MPGSPPNIALLEEAIAYLEATTALLKRLAHTDPCPSCGRPRSVPKPGPNVVDLHEVCDACQPVAPITEPFDLDPQR